MKIGIHQPYFFPYPGYFKKMYESDIFISLDNVKCIKNSYTNRMLFSSNKATKTFWLNIPLPKISYKQQIKDVRPIDSKWIVKHVNYLKNEHGKSQESNLLDEIISHYESSSQKYVDESIPLHSFNMVGNEILYRYLDLGKTPSVIVISETKMLIELNAFKKQDLVMEIIHQNSGTEYISGIGAKAYQDEQRYADENIALSYLDFDNEKAKIDGKYVSMLDITLRLGKDEARKIITGE